MGNQVKKKENWRRKSFRNLTYLFIAAIRGCGGGSKPNISQVGNSFLDEFWFIKY